MTARRFDGRVVFITGAASGIGRASAERFASEGARTVIADIDDARGAATADRITLQGGECRYLHCDVSDSAQVRAALDETATVFGGLDVLFVNAAHMADYHGVLETSEEAWDRTIDVGLKGAFLCAKYALPRLLDRGGGVILATSSIGGQLAMGRMAAYCSAKGGLQMLIRSIALDYGHLGIRANALQPGRVRPPDGSAESADTKHISLLPQPYADPEAIAAAAAFLASDEASFVTGCMFPIDGGWSTHWLREVTDRAAR